MVKHWEWLNMAKKASYLKKLYSTCLRNTEKRKVRYIQKCVRRRIKPNLQINSIFLINGH